jgi:hypothetical protein
MGMIMLVGETIKQGKKLKKKETRRIMRERFATSVSRRTV